VFLQQVVYCVFDLYRGSIFVGDFLFSRYRLMLLAVVIVVLIAVWLARPMVRKTALSSRRTTV
jgi:hypothetical protein